MLESNHPQNFLLIQRPGGYEDATLCLEITLQSHSTISLNSELQICVGSLCEWDTTNVTKWVPNYGITHLQIEITLRKSYIQRLE